MIEHPDYYTALANFCRTLHAKRGLDVGLAWGESAHAFLSTNPEATLVCIDLKDDMGTVNWLNNEFPQRARFIFGDSSESAKELKEKFDWINIDADHSYEGCKKDIEACLPLLSQNGVMAFDDYHTYDGVKKVLDEKFGSKLQKIPNHPSGAMYIRADQL